MDKIEPAYYADRYDRNVNDLEYLERDIEILLEKLNEVIEVVNVLATHPKLPQSGSKGDKVA